MFRCTSRWSSHTCPLHLNAKQRKKAEAAAHSLRYAQVALARHRQRLNGRAATESSITAPLLKSARAAIKRYRRIAHPGEPARRAFESAKRDYERITRAMARDLERELLMAEWTMAVADAFAGEQ